MADDHDIAVLRHLIGAAQIWDLEEAPMSGAASVSIWRQGARGMARGLSAQLRALGDDGGVDSDVDTVRSSSDSLPELLDQALRDAKLSYATRAAIATAKAIFFARYVPQLGSGFHSLS